MKPEWTCGCPQQHYVEEADQADYTCRWCGWKYGQTPAPAVTASVTPAEVEQEAQSLQSEAQTLEENAAKLTA